jgi:hypothetical protein
VRRLLVAFLLTGAALPTTAQAHQSPPGCAANGADLSLSRNRATVRPGQTVTYTVAVSNAGAGACDVTDAKATFTAPTGDPVTLEEHRALLSGSPLATIGSPAWPVPADQPAGQALASADLTGVLHDAPTDHTVAIAKTLGVDVVVPKLAATLTAVPATGVAPLKVTFHLKVANLSAPEAPLTSLDIDHPGCDAPAYAGGDEDGDGELDTTEEWEFTCTRTFDAGEYSGGATVAAVSPLDGGAVFASAAPVTVNASLPVSTAHLTLTRTANPSSGFAPLTVTHTYTVRNNGPTTPISDVAVSDGGCAPVVSDTSAPLAAGATRTFTCTSTLGVGTFSSSAIATGIDTVTGTRVNSDAVSADITAERAPDPIVQPVLDDAPPKPPATVKFSYTGRFTPARSCKGTVTLTLKAAGRTLATKRLKLDRRCRYKVSFTIARTRLGKATKVTVRAKAGRRTASRTLAVPKR